MRIAFFISGHGLGHASRSYALIESLYSIRQDIEFVVVTSTPEWIQLQSTQAQITRLEFEVDPGIRQSDSLTLDTESSKKSIAGYLDTFDKSVSTLAPQLGTLDAVVCDISPLGLAIAQRKAVPSFLIENFLWDWIYLGLSEVDSSFAQYASWYTQQYSTATFHLQTQPICSRINQVPQFGAISRCLKTPGTASRQRLKISPESNVILISLPLAEVDRFLDSEVSRLNENWIYAMPSTVEETYLEGNRLYLGANSYHPDSVDAADIVIGKLGYSTVAEIIQSQKPFAYFSRDWFPESSVLESYVKARVPAMRLRAEQRTLGDCLDVVTELLTGNQHHVRSEVALTETVQVRPSDHMASWIFERINSNS